MPPVLSCTMLIWRRSAHTFLADQQLQRCWTLGSMLPVCFATWTNHLSWILTLAIVAETNTYRFWSDDNRYANNWYQSDRYQVQNSPDSRWGGDCWTLGSMLPVCFATWTNRFLWILTLEIIVETNACGFWSNDNHDSSITLLHPVPGRRIHYFP